MSLALLRALNIPYQVYGKQLDANLTLTARYPGEQGRAQARDIAPQLPDAARGREPAPHQR